MDSNVLDRFSLQSSNRKGREWALMEEEWKAEEKKKTLLKVLKLAGK